MGGGDYFSIGRAIHLPYEVVEIWTYLASQGIWNKNEVSWQAAYPKASIHYFPCRLLDNLFLSCLSRNQNPKEFQHCRRWKAFISGKEVTLLCWSCNEVVRITMAVAQSAVQLWKCEPGWKLSKCWSTLCGYTPVPRRQEPA